MPVRNTRASQVYSINSLPPKIRRSLAQMLLPFTGLSGTQLFVLALIYDTPEMKRSFSSLSEAANLGPVTISRAADKFERYDLAHRCYEQEDGRLITLELTAKGRRLLEAIGSP